MALKHLDIGSREEHPVEGCMSLVEVCRMLFSVIYSVDVPADENVNDFAPPRLNELWDQTEGDSEYQYSYLEGCWEEGSHRKWCAFVTREQFDEFVNDCSLYAKDVQTMGSLGSPSFDYGWSPTISFNSDS